jgi:hypothetical protein
MHTIIGTGASVNGETKSAVTDAVKKANSRLHGRKPSYGFLFVSPLYDLRSALGTARRAADCDAIIGCSTAGEITEAGLTHDGVAAMLVTSDASTARMAYCTGMTEDPTRVADELYRGFSDLKRTATSREHRRLTSVLLTDGLASTGERLVGDVYDRAPSGAQIVGGAAGDDDRFKTTMVGAGEQADGDAAAGLHVFSTSAWGIGVNHGLRATTKQMRVTKAHDNVVVELDGEPAFNAYERHAAGRGIQLTKENAVPYMIANELGIHFFEKITRARVPLKVDSDGALTCAGDIPKGSMVSIVDGDPERMIEAAKAASEEAHDHLRGVKAAGVLLFDCVCRGMILKEQFHREVDAVRSVFGDVPIAGFLTYGEIARYSGHLDGWHNNTAVVVAIPAS